MKIKVNKTLNIIIGIMISSIGTAFLYEAGLGSAPIATLTEGLALFFQISYGLSNVLVNGVSLLIMLLMLRELIGVGTILSTFLFGYFIDLSVLSMQPLNIPEWGPLGTTGALILGTVLSAAGVGYYIVQVYGIGAVDALAIILDKRTKLTFTQCRWLLDGIMALTGIILGGAWGLGTVLTVIFSGPIINWVMVMERKWSTVRV